MEQATLNQSDLNKLLQRYDIKEFVQYIDRKGTLPDRERAHIKSLKTKEETVTYLYEVLSADSHKFDVFLDEFYLFASESLSIALRQTLDLKKRKQAGVDAKKKTDGERKRPDSSSSGAHVHLQVRTQEQTPHTASKAFGYPGEIRQEAPDHVSGRKGQLSLRDINANSVYLKCMCC